MTLLRHPASGTLVAIVAAGLAVGCLGSSPNVSLYTMNAISAAAATGAPDGLAIGVGPIRLPRYLDRPEWVTRSGGSSAQIEVDDYRQWAGGFSSNVLSALGQDLGAKLGTQRVVIYPAPTAFALDYRVAVDFHEFEAIGGDALVLRANWVIRAGSGDAGPWSGQATIRRNVAGGSEGFVGANHDALDQLADAIALRIEDLAKAAPHGLGSADQPPD